VHPVNKDAYNHSKESLAAPNKTISGKHQYKIITSPYDFHHGCLQFWEQF